MLNIVDKTVIPTSGMCFINCFNYFLNKDYTDEFRDFIRSEKYRSGVMTCARIQPFCKKNKISTLVVLIERE